MPREAIPLPSPQPLAIPPDFDTALHALGVSLTPQQRLQLSSYLALLLAMNEHMNLTAVTDPEQVWQRHALDALSLCPLLADIAPSARVLDVGSGGGIPGIILAIARPDLRLTLVEATQKKAAFLEAVAQALGLANVEVLAERAELLTKSALRATFDAVTARAVAKIEVLLPWTAPFVKPGARLLLIKGERAPEELRDAQQVMKRLRCSHERTLVTTTGRIVVLRVAA